MEINIAVTEAPVELVKQREDITPSAGMKESYKDIPEVATK